VIFLTLVGVLLIMPPTLVMCDQLATNINTHDNARQAT
jgi:hypothetical protein